MIRVTKRVVSASSRVRLRPTRRQAGNLRHNTSCGGGDLVLGNAQDDLIDTNAYMGQVREQVKMFRTHSE